MPLWRLAVRYLQFAGERLFFSWMWRCVDDGARSTLRVGCRLARLDPWRHSSRSGLEWWPAEDAGAAGSRLRGCRSSQSGRHRYREEKQERDECAEVTAEEHSPRRRKSRPRPPAIRREAVRQQDDADHRLEASGMSTHACGSISSEPVRREGGRGEGEAHRGLHAADVDSRTPQAESRLHASAHREYAAAEAYTRRVCVGSCGLAMPTDRRNCWWLIRRCSSSSSGRPRARRRRRPFARWISQRSRSKVSASSLSVC